MAKDDKNIDLLLEEIFYDLTPKQRRVLTGRFGLKTGNRQTLQAIGDELKITRERVRQIEEQAMKKIAKRLEREAAWVLEAAEKHLKTSGGVRREDSFLKEMIHNLKVAAGVKFPERKLSFIFVAAGKPQLAKETDQMNGYWFLDEKAKAKFTDFIKEVHNFLKSSKKEEVLNKKSYQVYCKNLISYHLLSIPKYFGTNVFGDFGLRDWPEIEPKTIRDKVYLVLRKHAAPLHFEQIASAVAKYGLDKKPAHVQTVHNELIKDERFVLVGRGIYALKEHGFEKGTVREVIARLLKKHGSLNSTEVVKLVNEQRWLKENTILLNLQNRRYFRRLPNGRYEIREA
jgi:DNA-directed RNA polymerase delta subunit